MTDELSIIIPDAAWPVDEEYRDYYDAGVEAGRAVAAESDVAIVAIARNAVPFIANTLLLCASVVDRFRSAKMFVFENDSTDGTDRLLDEVAASVKWFSTAHETLGGPDSRGFERDRTERLAYCRNKCLEWVRENAAGTPWTIVVDMDPQAGFSPDGVLNSVARLSEQMISASTIRAGGMASYSLYRKRDGVAHYDAWAARPVSWWRDRRNEIGFNWFSAFLPPVGSPPCPMNSAFGGLTVYRTEAFLAGGYSGDDCEHVPHHRRMREAGYGMWLNPGCRYVAYWEE